MKIISGENVDEGVRATASFVGLFYRIVMEGGITNDQTAYLPVELDWEEYLSVTVTDDAEPDVDQSLLRLGAMVAAVSWLYDAYSEESFPERTGSVVARLRDSEFGAALEVLEFLNSVHDLEKQPGPQRVLEMLYRKFVLKWWNSQLHSKAPKPK